MQLGQITIDNAYNNNNTLMAEIESELGRRNIPFDRDGNRLRCFPHVVNPAVQAILAELKTSPRLPVLAVSTDPANDATLQAYVRALENDPIGECREIISACRSSG
ncbi:hypothetical protein AZE42_02327 [Rhizopogon vesiculosus]|uniref:Uncharacterized protein n=1 Tax=Rhizopogon vesiculosus TaxID=180088 RepID=A0A1J8PKQ2_9AGAM|nr:hypothetical protein AZE42_02327 [Rhizopogon vesiculosus]